VGLSLTLPVTGLPGLAEKVAECYKQEDYAAMQAKERAYLVQLDTLRFSAMSTHAKLHLMQARVKQLAEEQNQAQRMHELGEMEFADFQVICRRLNDGQKELQEMEQREATLAQSIAQKEQEYEEIQDQYETLKAQKSLSQAVLEAYAEPEQEIEVQRTPAKKNPITKQETPAQVTMAEADYLTLKERAAATTWIRRAMEDLKHLGERLTRELNQRRRVAELREQAASAEVAARAAEIDLANARAEIADLRQQAHEQQEWMEQQTTRSGKTIWEFFMDFITKQREREFIDRDERE
jgi:chromosome segregation ATPase